MIQNALVKELRRRGLVIDTQRRIPLYYRGEYVGVYVPDIVVNNSVFIELKCKPILTRGDEQQFWYYLKGSQFKVGLLINFGPTRLQIKRRVFDKARSASDQRQKVRSA